MAGISTAIQITDRVTAPLLGIISSLEATQNAFEDLGRQMDESFDTSRLDAARAEIASAMEQINHVGDGIDDNTGSQQRFNAAVSAGDLATGKLLATVGSLVAAYASIETVKKVVEISDEMVSINARIAQMNQGFEKAGKSAMDAAESSNLIFQAAENARGSYSGMADVVARFGNNARDAFSGTEEVVRFANIVQKQMTIAGASAEEASNAMLQLSQALGSGVLRGDELNSIFEQSPNLIQSIADYLGVSIGQIRNLASEGELTADIVKNAILASSNEVNAAFESMPMTWGQVWQSIQNQALAAFQPVLDKINELANNPALQNMASKAVNAMGVIAGHIVQVMDLAAQGAQFIADNWSVIEPIVMGIVTALGLYIAALVAYNAVSAIAAAASAVKAAADMMSAGATFAAAAAQYGFNAALLACPLTWIVLAIMAAVVAGIAFANHIAQAGGTAQTWFGVICGWINVVIQFFKNLGLTVANIALGIWNALGALCNNMVTAFKNAIASVQGFFYNLAETATSVIISIANALNELPFVDFDVSGLVSAANTYAAKSAQAYNSRQDYQDVGAAMNEGMHTFDTFGDDWVNDAYNAGANFGDGIGNKINNLFSGGSTTSSGKTDYSNLFNSSAGAGKSNLANQLANVGSNGASTAKNTGDIAKNTASAAKSLSATSENLKYIRDLASQKYINRFTTAQIKVTMNNKNSINSRMDLDGITKHLRKRLEEEMSAAAEGVYT